jgi:23S rRNA pseudouridine2605 synthase
MEKKKRDNRVVKNPVKGNTFPIRLNKYIANAGICSRRDADELIKSGQIKVNDK